MNNILISIIIPVYNVVGLLERCVSSVCRQTYQMLEIILIDDGSTDGSGELCDKLMVQDDRIRVVHQENNGSTAARNKGIEIARGTLLGFVDSDDYIEPDMYENMIEVLVKENADICVCRQYIDKQNMVYVEKGRSIVKGVLEKASGDIADHIIYTNDMSNKGISPNLCDKIFKKEIIQKYQFNIDLNTKYAEDDLCVYACLLDAERIVFVDKPLYHYCVREGSITQSGDEFYFEKINLFYTQMKAIFESQERSDLLVNKLNHYMIEFVIRGINRSFGFGYGTLIPFYIPPYEKLMIVGARKLVLYGAGDVGKAYYRSFQMIGLFEVVLWADIRWERLSKLGMRVEAPEKIREVSYDIVLIAADNEMLEEQIRQYLTENLRVPDANIIGGRPIKFLETF